LQFLQLATSSIEDRLKDAAYAAQQDELRYSRESERLDKEANRLRDKANELEIEAKRLRSNMDDACRRRETLEFEALCLALSRNDASITKLPCSQNFPKGYARQLGNALKYNRQVTSVEISYCTLLPETIEEGEVNVFLSPLVKFLRTSAALRQVEIDCCAGTRSNKKPTLDEKVIGACFRNRNIEELYIRESDFSEAVFSSYLVSSSLKTLQIHVYQDGDYSRDERLAFKDVFCSFTSLTSLNVFASDPALVENMLSGLRSAGCLLEELCLEFAVHQEPELFWSTLSGTLHDAKNLKHLLLQHFQFVAQNMQALTRGLTRKDDSILVVSLRELTLRDCTFATDALKVLSEFMQTKTYGKASMLQKLNLDCAARDENGFLGTLLVPMLCKGQDCGERANSELWYPTIGSRIESLYLDPCNDGYSGFFKLMAENSHRMDLAALTVADLLDQNDVNSLAECMLMCGPLQTLVVQRSNTNVYPILRSLRGNGNITSMSVSYFSSKEVCAKFTKLYTERNQFLRRRLMHATSGKSEVCQQGQPKESLAGLFLLPTLFEVAKQIPAQRASTLTTCLLRLLDNCEI
jgi:hypothetical protein